MDKPLINYIYLVVHDLYLHTTDLGEHEILISYGGLQYNFNIPDNTYLKLQFYPKVWNIDVQVIKKENKNKLKQLTLDIR